MKKMFVVMFIFIGIISSLKAQVCVYPPFMIRRATPNVLVILDNSNSMDEDFYGNAVGSNDDSSKSVVARTTIENLIDEFGDKMRIGLMTYKQSSMSLRHIHNSPYFVSYQPKSYCPDPPPECVEYCCTGNPSARAICETECKQKNPSFDIDYFDEIITTYPLNSSTRCKYCNLVYPKTQKVTNPTDPSHYIYFKHAYPFYSSHDEGTAFAYAPSYNPHEGCQWTSGSFCATDWYRIYRYKTGTSDGYSGYSSLIGTYWFGPTDTDIALGYWDFGRRMSWWHVGLAWFSNVSPGPGLLQVEVADVTAEHKKKLKNKLGYKDGDTGINTGYSYFGGSGGDIYATPIRNAGLTPLAGTIYSARKYFEGHLPSSEAVPGVDRSSPIQAWCQNNFVILVTDGLPSVDENGHRGNADDLIKGVAARIEELRHTSYNGDIFDIKTYVVGVALGEAKSKLDTLAVVGGTAVDGHAYYADNPEQLKEALRNIFVDILNRTASASAVAIATTASSAQGLAYQAYFTPKKLLPNQNISWIGSVRGFFIDNYGNLREDTDEDHGLTLNKDFIIKIKFDASIGHSIVERYRDEDGDGYFSPSDLVDTVAYEDVHAVWDGGKFLWESMSPSQRNIKVFVDLNLNGKAESNEVVDFVASKASLLRPYLDVSSVAEAETVINYLRGVDYDSPNYRNRTYDGHVWKLGDIIYSTPTFVGEPGARYDVIYNDETYGVFRDKWKDRRRIVIVGANDGMVHAFNTGKIVLGDNPATVDRKETFYVDGDGEPLGKELWAFIPFNLLPHLAVLKDSSYENCHRYYVDLKVKVADVRIWSEEYESSTGKHPYGWGTLAIVGMRFGGQPITVNVNGTNITFRSAYFAIDITDPENPEYLWEFTHPNLGYTIFYPSVIKVKNKWFIVIGSGPTDLDACSDQNGRIFVIDPLTGQLLKTFTLSAANSFVSGIASLDVGMDYSVDVLYISTNILVGSEWYGKVFRLNTFDSESPDDWQISELTSGYTQGAISAAPSVTFDKYGNLWVFFGTGRYFVKSDEEINRYRYLYGVMDDHYEQGDGSVDPDGLFDVTNCSMVEEEGAIIIKQGTNSYTLSEFVLNQIYPHHGWKMRLAKIGERNVTKPVVIGGAVLFSTFKPVADICAFGGSGNLYILYYLTGTNIVNNEKVVSLEQGTPSQPTAHLSEQEKAFIQSSSGAIEEVELKLPIKLRSGVILWRLFEGNP